MAQPRGNQIVDAVDAEMCFLHLVKLSCNSTTEFEPITKTLQDAMAEFVKAKCFLVKEENPPEVVKTLCKSLDGTCNVGEMLLTLCTKFIETLSELRNVVINILNSKEIKDEDLKKQIQLCKIMGTGLKNVSDGIVKFQETLKEAAAAHGLVAAYCRQLEKKANEWSQTSRSIAAGFKCFGTGLLIVTAGGLIIATAGAALGAAAGAAVGAAAGGSAAVSGAAVTGAGIGASIADFLSLPFAAGTGISMGSKLADDLVKIRSEGAEIKLAQQRISIMQENLYTLRKELDSAADGMQGVTALSAKCTKDVQELVNKIKAKIEQQERMDHLQRENEKLVKNKKDQEEQQERMQRENEELKRRVEELELLQKQQHK